MRDICDGEWGSDGVIKSESMISPSLCSIFMHIRKLSLRNPSQNEKQSVSVVNLDIVHQK